MPLRLERLRTVSISWNPLKWFPARWFGFALRQWRLLTSAVIAAAIVHIVVTLSASQFETSKAFRTLTRDLPVNSVTFGKAVSAKTQPLPFYSADALYSYCRYDASASRIRLSAKLPAVGWSLSLHTPKGENFYYVPGSASQATNVELVLVPPGNVFAPSEIEVVQDSAGIPQVKLPVAHGLAVLRAPIKGFAYRRQVDEIRGSFSCHAQDVATGRR